MGSSVLRRRQGSVKGNSIRMKTTTAIISIQDLSSEGIPTVSRALKALPGVESVDFSVERSVAVVEFDKQQSSVDDLLRAVLKAGFRVM
jgi:copper chaperone CopZ